MYFVLSTESVNNTMNYINIGLDDIGYWIHLAQDGDHY
jgi:hypothetical protein